MEQLARLKTAIKVHLTTAGPSEALCRNLLKLVDFLEPSPPGIDRDVEMDNLALSIIRGVCNGVLARMSDLNDWRLAASIISLSETLAKNDFQAIVKSLNGALISLGLVTGIDYPDLRALQ